MPATRLTCSLPNCTLGQEVETGERYKTAPHWETNTEVQTDMAMHLEVHKLMIAPKAPATRLVCPLPTCISGQGLEASSRYKTPLHMTTTIEAKRDMSRHLDTH